MRITPFDNAEGREDRMREHVEQVARSIIDNHDGDEVFDRFLRLTRHVHNYSPTNRMLIAFQVPEARLVASKTAFGEIAKGQGHEGVTKGPKGKTWKQWTEIAKGAKGVWVWGPPMVKTVSEEKEDPTTGETTTVDRTFKVFKVLPVWAIEDVRYCDTGEPVEAPDFVQPVHDPNLHAALLEFAISEGITVTERGLGGARGVSTIGGIGLQQGDPYFLQVAPLIHELGHELLHGIQERLTLPTEVLEYEAEAVAAVVLGFLGFPTGISAAYLRNWGATPKQVLSSMKRIADAAGKIVEFIGERLDFSEREAEEAATTQEEREAVVVNG